MTIEEVGRFRLRCQWVESERERTPAEVVKRLTAVQAQDYAAAKWAVGLRCAPEVREADIEKAIADRSIVRTWPMRGTLHFVAAEDVHWMLRLLTPRIVAGSATRQRQLELDDTTFNRCRELFAVALAGGKQLTRDEMYQALEQEGIATTGQRGYHLLWRTAQDGLICFGPHKEKQPTFVLLEEWVPERHRPSREEALGELTRRYFTGHGPATVQDFAWWAGLSLTEARAGLDLASAHLVSETVDGGNYWLAADEERGEKASQAGAVHLLPGFDQYLLGYKDRTAVLDPAHAQKIVPGNNGVFLPTLVIDGRVVGTWKRVVRKGSVVVTAEPFDGPLDEAQRCGFADAAARYGRFLGLPAVVPA